jgi:hypothetical protein
MMRQTGKGCFSGIGFHNAQTVSVSVGCRVGEQVDRRGSISIRISMSLATVAQPWR